MLFLENFNDRLEIIWVFFQFFFHKLRTESIKAYFWQKFKNIKNAEIQKTFKHFRFNWFLLVLKKRMYIYWFIQFFLFTNKLIFLKSSLITIPSNLYYVILWKWYYCQKSIVNTLIIILAYIKSVFAGACIGLSVSHHFSHAVIKQAIIDRFWF